MAHIRLISRLLAVDPDSKIEVHRAGGHEWQIYLDRGEMRFEIMGVLKLCQDDQPTTYATFSGDREHFAIFNEALRSCDVNGILGCLTMSKYCRHFFKMLEDGQKSATGAKV